MLLKDFLPIVNEGVALLWFNKKGILETKIYEKDDVVRWKTKVDKYLLDMKVMESYISSDGLLEIWLWEGIDEGN